MSTLLLTCALLPLFASLIVYPISKKNNNAGYIVTCAVCGAVLACAAALLLTEGIEYMRPSVITDFWGFSSNRFNTVLLSAAAVMWFVTTVFAKPYFAPHGGIPARYLSFTLATLGATAGVFLAADLITLLTCFEIMSFTSFVWVIQEETQKARRAACTYLAIAVLGGMSMLAGMFILWRECGTLQLSALDGASGNGVFTAAVLMLVGFGAKAGMFPLHIWLPTAHPEAPAPASALLSGILTKTGIYGTWLLGAFFFAGDGRWSSLLLVLGLITMVLGAVMALLSVNIKRILACSSMSQLGFIIVGLSMASFLGDEGSAAMRGALLHMLNHSALKLLLFICAGVIYAGAHTLDLNELRGYGRKKPLLAVCFVIGALGISGIPLFNGYISKTLLHESISEFASVSGSYLITAAEWIFLISGGLTLAYMTKLFAAVFIEKGKYEKKEKYLTPASAFSICFPALIVLALGVAPAAWGAATYALSSEGAGTVREYITMQMPGFFAPATLSGALVTLVVGAAVYFIAVRRLLMKDGKYVAVNTFGLEERVYRPLLKYLSDAFGALCALFAENKVSSFVASKLFIAAGVLTKIVCDLVDMTVYLLSVSIYRTVRASKEPEIGTKLSYRLGHAAEKLRAVGDALSHREKKSSKLTVSFALKEEAFRDMENRIRRSFSFALLMAGIGICVVFIYLLANIKSQ